MSGTRIAGVVVAVLLIAAPVGAVERLVVFARVAGLAQAFDESPPTVSGTVALEIDVIDQYSVPHDETPLRLRLLIDHEPVGAPFTVANLPFLLSWNSVPVADGPHALSLEVLEVPTEQPYIPFSIVVVVDNQLGPVSGPQELPLTPHWVQLLGQDDGHGSFRGSRAYWPGALPERNGHPQPPVAGIPFAERLEGFDLYVEQMMPTIALFSKNHRFFQNGDGQVLALAFNTYGSDDYEGGGETVDRLPFGDGPRGVAYVTAYTNGTVHPTTEELFFVEQARTRGRLAKVGLDGTVTTLAGWRTRSNFLPFVPHDESIPDALRSTQYELVGSFADGPAGFQLPMDVAVDPLDPDIVFVADAKNHRIARVDTSQTPAVVTTWAGSLSGEEGLVDGAGTVARFHEPLSLAIAPDRTIYVADRDNNRIRRIAPDRAVTTLVGQGFPNVPPIEVLRDQEPEENRSLYMINGPFAAASIIYPMVIRLDPQGRLLIGEEQLGTLRRLDFSSQTVSLFTLAPSTSAWIWFDVDREGTFGPPGDIFFASAVGQAGGSPSNEVLVRIAADGSLVGDLFEGSYLFEGRLDMTRAPHYVWMVAVGQGALWSNGFGTDGLVRVRKARSEDRVDDHDAHIYTRFWPGNHRFHTGTADGFPWGVRPSFNVHQGFYGWNELGVFPSFDALAATSDAELARRIQDGWGSGIARPEISGNDLRNVIFFVRRLSLPAIHAGVLPGPDDPDVDEPAVSNVAFEERTADTLRVTWQTDEPTLGVVEFGNAAANLFRVSDPENGYGTAHAAVIGPLIAGRNYVFRVRVRDSAGNLDDGPELPLLFQGSAPADTSAPSVPVAVDASGISSSEIVVTWSPASDDRWLAGYRVFRDGHPVVSTTATRFADAGLPPAAAHSYRVTAFDTARNFSALSAPVTASTLPATLIFADGFQSGTTGAWSLAQP